jgi:hypothetical protein
MVTATEIRARYIAALQAADAGDCRPLLEFLENPWTTQSSSVTIARSPLPDG